jgi:hypothetical protein
MLNEVEVRCTLFILKDLKIIRNSVFCRVEGSEQMKYPYILIFSNKIFHSDI